MSVSRWKLEKLRGELPCTEDNLRLVTSVVWVKKFDIAGLLVEHEELGKGKDFEALRFVNDDLEPVRGMGRRGVRAIVKILEAFTKKSFEIVENSEDLLLYRRADYHSKVLEFEAASRANSQEQE